MATAKATERAARDGYRAGAGIAEVGGVCDGQGAVLRSRVPGPVKTVGFGLVPLAEVMPR